MVMYRPCLLLLLGLPWLQASPIYDNNDRLNLSASCPDATCSLWQLQGDMQHPLRMAGGQVSQLQELLLGDSRMRSLPVELLLLAPNLRRLLVQNCSVIHAEKEHFEATPQLRQLLMQGNFLSRLKQQQFVALHQLEVLQLGHNHIQFIHAQAFEGLAQLRLLGLAGNDIAQLMDGGFDALPNLLHLDLSDNEIGQLNTRTFAKNEKLQTLLLNGNQFAHFEPRSLAALANLRLLDLSYCGGMPELQVRGAQSLLLEGSGVQRLIIDGSVINLKAGNNALTQLSIADKSSVIALDLHGNQMGDNATSTLLVDMWNLQRLDLSKNIIESLLADGLSLLLPSLTHLNLAHNKLRLLPPDSSLLPSRLRDLDISYNHMLAVGSQNFAALPSLQRLHIEGNRLQQFDYEQFHRQHPSLQELGVCDDEGSLSIMHKMAIYLSDRGVHLTVRCLPRQDRDNDTPMNKPVEPAAQVIAEPQTRLGVCGIHPYWTMRDYLALITLLVVFAILLMQLYNILEEEGLLRRMRQCFRRNRTTTMANGRSSVTRSGPRSRRLNEEDSEV